MRVRKLIKAFLIFLASLAGLLFLVFVILNLSFSQRYLAGRINGILESAGIPVHINSVDRILPGSVSTEGILISGSKGDTIVYAGKLKSSFKTLAFLNRRVIIQSVKLENARISFLRKSGDDQLNIVAAFAGEEITEPAKTGKEKKPWDISIGEAEISGLAFRMNDSVAGIYIREDAKRIRIETKKMSLSENTIIPSSVEILGSTGSITLNQESPEAAGDSSTPWIFGIGRIHATDLNFVFDDPRNKFRIDLLAGDIKIDASGSDLAGKYIAFDKIAVSKTSARILTDKTNGGADIPGEDKSSVFPWRIKGDDLLMQDVSFSLLSYSAPEEDNIFSGFNFAGLGLEISDIRYDSTEVNADLEKLEGNFGNGFSIRRMSGKLSSDAASARMEIDLVTSRSSVRIEGNADENLFSMMKDPAGIKRAELLIDRSVIDPEDLFYFMPGLRKHNTSANQPPYLFTINTDLKFDGNILKVNDISVELAPVATVTIRGNIRNIFTPDKASADLNYVIKDISSKGIRELIGKLSPGITLPSFTRLSASGVMRDSLMSPHIEFRVTSDIGEVNVSGSADIRKDNFAVQSSIKDLHLGNILANQLFGTLNGSAEVTGRGIFKKPLVVNASLLVDSVGFNGYNYTLAQIGFSIRDSIYDLHLDIEDPSLAVDLAAVMKLTGREMSGTLTTFLDADLYRLHLFKDSLTAGCRIKADLRKHGNAIYGSAGISDIEIRTPVDRASVKEISLSVSSDSASTKLEAASSFFSAEGHAGSSVQVVGEFFINYLRYLGSLIDPQKSGISKQLPHIPELSGKVSLNYNNAFRIFIPDTSIYFKDMDLTVHTDPVKNIIRYTAMGNNLRYRSFGFGRLNASLSDSSSSITLDIGTDSCMIGSQTVNRIQVSSHFSDWESLSAIAVTDRHDITLYSFEIATEPDSSYLIFKIPSGHVTINGGEWHLDSPKILRISEETGIYMPSLRMQKDSSYILFSGNDMNGWQALNLELNKVRLSDLFRTEIIKGKQDAILTGTAGYETNSATGIKVTTGLQMSDVSWSDLHYKSIILEGSLVSDTTGNSSFNASSILDTAEIRIKGESKHEEGKDLSASFERIPVNTIQPFVKKYLSDLNGNISGDIILKSRADNYTVNGEILINDGNLRIKTLNSAYRLPEAKISFSGNKMLLSGFRVLDSLNNELNVDGFIDFGNQKPVNADLEISSSNLQVMNLKEDRNSVFYGNVFVNSKLDVKGPVASPVFSGRITLAKGTDIYLRQTENLNYSESQNVVTFVSRKPAGREVAQKSMAYYGIQNKTSIASIVEIDPSTKINIEVSRKMFNIDLEVEGGGEINYNMLVNSQVNMTGKYEIYEGAANLKMVGWPNKAFRLTKGGYIRWDGNLEDPELQLEAVNRVKSSYVNPVDNKERYVDFDVTLKISNRLSDMNVLFTISTADQYLMSIINTMSPEDQMRQAITILLFEYIDLPGISTSSNYVSEQVNQMVSAQLNSLTKTTIKGIDISFGIDTHTQGTSSGGEQTKTSLSYEVRKKLLNDRAKVEFTGIVSDASQSQNSNTSYNNFSFEYRIDSAATKFLKVYNEHSYEDVFEGDVVKTGIGFTYRKNYPAIKDIWRRKEKSGKQNNR